MNIAVVIVVVLRCYVLLNCSLCAHTYVLLWNSQNLDVKSISSKYKLMCLLVHQQIRLLASTSSSL